MDINFLEPGKEPPRRGPSLQGFLLILILTIATLLAFGGVIALQRTSGKNNGGVIFRTIRGLLRSDDIALRGEEENRINILLLGMGGKGHDGGYLTDTIVVASVRPTTGEGALLSIPRDLVVLVNKNEWRKINSVSAYAEMERPESGGEATRQAIEELLQIPIPYYVRADFAGFEQLVDAVGGVVVTVENRLEDKRYPIPGNEDLYPVELRYKHLIIEKGTQAMDGGTALQYVRSRRALGIEGSDFARTKRQQNVMLALKEKVFSWGTVINPARIERILDSLSSHITTNITFGEGMRLLQIAKQIDREHVHRATLSDAPDGLLAARIANGAYILEPRDGTFAAIRERVHNIFQESPRAEVALKPTIRVAILNGTTTTGLAKAIGEILAGQDFIITAVGNAPVKPVPKTIIYDLTDGNEYLAYDRLRLLLEAVPPEKNVLQFTLPTFDAPPDFIIILGENTKQP